MRRYMAVFIIALTASAAAFSQTAPQSPPPATVHSIFVEDQTDQPQHTPRNDPTPESLKALDDRAAARRAALHGMLSRGEINSGSDLYEAAFVFQHGETAPDYLLAHVLALDALTKGFERARWLSVATLDRYLQLIGQPQVFGTQYPLDPKLPHPITNGGRFSGRTQAPFDDTFLPAYIRRDFCVPDLEQQKKNLQTLNSGSYPRSTLTLPGCER
jgi:hypothetical protein